MDAPEAAAHSLNPGGGGGGSGNDDGGGSVVRGPALPHRGDDSHFPLWNRLVMSLLAMSLLWASSLRTAVFFTEHFVRIPPATFPLRVCRSAFDAVSAQATSYRACVTRQLATCNADLDFAAEQERNRSTTAGSTNVLKLDAAEKLYSDCGIALTTSRAAILKWTQHSSLNEVPYVQSVEDGTCSAADKTRAQVVLGDTSGSKSQVMASSAQYSKESKGTVRRMAEYTQALNAYNAEYLANKTKAIRASALTLVAGINAPRVGTINASFADVQLQLAALVACLAPGDVATATCSLPGMNARERLEILVNEMQSRFDAAAADYFAYIDNWKQVAASSAATFDAFRSFYNGLLNAVAELGLTRQDFGGLLDVDFNNFLVPPGPFFDGEGVIKNLPCCLPTLDGIWSAVLPAVDMAVGNITLASVDTSLRALQWAQALEMSLAELDVAPADYNPPRYLGADGEPISVEAEVAAHDGMADTFVARTATSLDSFDSYNQYVDSGGKSNASQAANTTLLLDNLPSFDFSFNFKYETLESPNLDIDALLRVFDSIPNLAFLTDYAYRIYGSLRILWKFQTQTAIKLPAIDLRTRGITASVCIDIWQAVNPRRVLANLLVSRYLPYVLMVGLLLPLLVYGVILYVGAYQDYQHGCVFNTNPKGSYAARATNSLSYNFAAHGGNQAMYDGLKSYNQRRAQYCAEYGKSSQGAQLNAERYLATMRAAREEAQGKVQLLSGCLNLTALDDAFRRGCCGLSEVPPVPFDSTTRPATYESCAAAGFDPLSTNVTCPLDTNYDPARPFLPLSASLGAAACRDEADPALLATWTLEDGVFHCDVLPSCAPTCAGPHPELTQVWSRHCACASEWTLHAYLMAGSLAVLAYLLFNLARRLILQAVAQAQWRSLFAGSLTVLVPCDLQGHLVIRRLSSSSSAFGRRRWRGPLSPSRLTARVTPSSPPNEPSTPPALMDDGLIVKEDNAEDGHAPGAADGPGAGADAGTRPATAPPASAPAIPAAAAQSSMEADGDAHDEAQRAFIRRRIDATMRRYEAMAWVKGMLAIGLLVAAGIFISRAPQYLDYRP